MNPPGGGGETGSMPPTFLPMLLAWITIWVAAAGVALLKSGVSEQARGFWTMSLFWVAIDAGIAAWSLFAPVEDLEAFRRLLLVNSGLDVIYLIVGVVLLLRAAPLVRGFGIAILVQGGFLLVFDVAWWLATASSTGG